MIFLCLLDLLQKVREHKIPIRDEAAWEKYIKCEPIPNTKVPSECRGFLCKFQLDFEEYIDKRVNWWLRCNERSDMTQDDTRHPDVRRRIVEKKRKSTGSFYDKQMRLMMKAYESLEDTIRRKKVSAERLNDLINVSFYEAFFMFHFPFHLTSDKKELS